MKLMFLLVNANICRNLMVSKSKYDLEADAQTKRNSKMIRQISIYRYSSFIVLICWRLICRLHRWRVL